MKEKVRVHMFGGPKDGRHYDYPEPLPDVLAFQSFDADMNVHVVDYHRKPDSKEYYHMEFRYGC